MPDAQQSNVLDWRNNVGVDPITGAGKKSKPDRFRGPFSPITNLLLEVSKRRGRDKEKKSMNLNTYMLRGFVHELNALSKEAGFMGALEGIGGATMKGVGSLAAKVGPKAEGTVAGLAHRAAEATGGRSTLHKIVGGGVLGAGALGAAAAGRASKD